MSWLSWQQETNSPIQIQLAINVADKWRVGAGVGVKLWFQVACVCVHVCTKITQRERDRVRHERHKGKDEEHAALIKGLSVPRLISVVWIMLVTSGCPGDAHPPQPDCHIAPKMTLNISALSVRHRFHFKHGEICLSYLSVICFHAYI